MKLKRLCEDQLLTLFAIMLLSVSCSPDSQVAEGAGTQGAAGASAAASRASSATTLAAGAAAMSSVPPSAPSVQRSAPAAGASSPPAAASQAGRLAPPSVPTAGSAAATLAGRGGAQPPATQPPAKSAAAGSGGTAAPAASASGDAALAGVTADELEMLRNACVDGINMYRAMLPNLKPLKRATAAQETCSETGAQMDGDAMSPHMSARAGLCSKMGLYSENTCGGFPGGSAMALANSLKLCLQGFWAEGAPPGTREACMMDLQGCYEQHGHYINMTDPNIGSVACAYYKMKNGSYWLNHDFGY